MHHLPAVAELPDEVVIPPRLVVTRDAGGRVLERLAAHEAPNDALRASLMVKDMFRGLPRISARSRRLAQQWARAAGKRADRRLAAGQWRQWFLLLGRLDAGRLAVPDPAALTPVLPPADRFWADPFLWIQAGVPHVFVEELPRATGRGRISVLRLGPDLQATGPAQPVLDEPRHLSYPFLFEFGGALYMVPESARDGRVDLYRCEDFPQRWVRLHSLLTGIEVADATLFPHAGRWWLFCARRDGRLRMNESLCAFWADSPLSRHWTPHPANPLVRDFSGARPAGRVQCDAAGRLLRPAQDCVRRYGHGLKLFEILELTPTGYRERCLWHGTGPAVGGWQGLHHLDWHAGLVVMDAQRLVPG